MTNNALRDIRDHLNEGRFVEACEIFNGIDDDDVFAQVVRVYPNLSAYDARGNYVGSVAHENGWTA